MTFEQAKADAEKRAKNVGLIWHVILLSTGVFETVADYYFITHTKAVSLYKSQDYYGDNTYRGGKNRKERRLFQRMIDKLMFKKRMKEKKLKY